MAAEQLLSLNIKVNTDTGALEVLGAKFNDASSQAKGMESSFGGLSSSAKDLMGALGLVATIGGVVEFFKNAVTEANADAEALRRLSFALTANGVDWDAHKEKIISWSEGMQQLTRFSNTEALTSLAQLSKATKDVGQAQEGVRVAMGLSVAAGMPLNQALDLMQGLMMGNQRAIMMAHRELGTFVGGATTAQGMLDALSGKFRNAANDEDSYTKSVAHMVNAWDDFCKQVGKDIIPSLTKLVEFLTSAMEKIGGFDAAAETWRTKAVTSIKATFSSILAIVTGHTEDVKKILTDAANKNAAISQAEADAFAKAEKKKTDAVKAASDEAARIKAAAGLKDDAHAADQALKIEAIHAELQKKIQAMGVETYAKKLEIETQDYELEKAKIIKEIEDKTEEHNLLLQLETEHAAKKADLMRLEAQRQHTLALDTANTTLEGLAIVNSMMDKDSKGQVDRAIMILALEKAIAIARIWSSPTIAVPGYGMALAAAQTAVLVAQFAQQSQSIQQAASAHQQQANTSAITTTSMTDLGGGTILTQTDGNLPGLGPTIPGTPSSGIMIGASPSAQQGSGQVIQVSIPQITVNVAVDTLQVADRRAILQALADELRAGTVDSIRFAVTSANLASANAQVAV